VGVGVTTGLGGGAIDSVTVAVKVTETRPVPPMPFPMQKNCGKPVCMPKFGQVAINPYGQQQTPYLNPYQNPMQNPYVIPYPGTTPIVGTNPFGTPSQNPYNPYNPGYNYQYPITTPGVNPVNPIGPYVPPQVVGTPQYQYEGNDPLRYKYPRTTGYSLMNS